MDKARDLIMVIAKALVDNPDEVSVNVRSRENTVMLELSVDKEDIGKIIGRHGKIADSVRVLLGVRGGKARKNLVLEITDQKWPHAFQPGSCGAPWKGAVSQWVQIPPGNYRSSR